jgi:hypothetical protein
MGAELHRFVCVYFQPNTKRREPRDGDVTQVHFFFLHLSYMVVQVLLEPSGFAAFFERLTLGALKPQHFRSHLRHCFARV